MTSRRKFRSALDEHMAQERELVARFERDGIAWEFVYDTSADDLVPVPKEDAELDWLWSGCPSSVRASSVRAVDH